MYVHSVHRGGTTRSREHIELYREVIFKGSTDLLYIRPRSSPTCLTPCQCQKRVPLRELAVSPPNLTQRLEPRRLLYQSDSSHPVKEKWTPAKTSTLIEFTLFHTTGDRWPTHKQMVFCWGICASKISSKW